MPTCSCEGGTCALQFDIREGAIGRVALQPSQELTFELSAVNPAGPPDVVDNFWMVQHLDRSGGLVASAAAAGWDVYGQLRELSVRIAGLNSRAGSATDLAIEFVPAVYASVLDLEVHEPPGFDFVLCEPSSPLVVDRIRTQGARLVVSNGNYHGGQRAVIQLSQVTLGSSGGQTRISIFLYEDILQSPVNRRLNFLEGFRAPGRLNVVEQRLWSQAVVAHYDGSAPDELVPMLPAHSGEVARLDVFFNVTNEVMAGESLRVRSLARGSSTATRFQPRVDSDQPVALFSCGAAPEPSACAEPVALGFTRVSVVVNQADLFPYGLDLDLNTTSRLEADRLHFLRFWCIPSEGTLYWGASTQDSGLLPTNTNDGVTIASGAVAELAVRVELFAARSPPQSKVPVRSALRR